MQLQGFRHFVDIPVGSDFTVAEIFAKSDDRSEGSETVRWAPVADASYQLGTGNAGHVTIHDPPAGTAGTAGTGGTAGLSPTTRRLTARAARSLGAPARSLFSDDRIDERVRN